MGDKSMKKRIAMLGIFIAAVLSLSACGGDKDAAADALTTETEEIAEITEITETETEEEEVIPEGMYRSELTNELIDESLKNQRPIAAMVDNESIALPHYGLTQADVVYEMMNSTLNGRITRFMVLVKDWEKIEQLGSIRSVRPTNVLLAAEWGAVLCHDGGPFYVDQYMADPSVDNFSGTFSRVDNGKSREYTEYILAGDLEKNFENSNVSREYLSYYEGPHYQFAKGNEQVDLTAHTDSLSAEKVELPFQHNGSYVEYDKDSGEYLYYEYGKAHVDPGNDNKQLSFKNVLIQSAGFTQYDEHGYMIFDVITQGGGYYVTNGNAIYVTWKKESMTSPTRYYDSEGNEITLNTGKTYVALVPVDNWPELKIDGKEIGE